MREFAHIAAVIGLLILSGCNTTDALTPQEDIPNASAQDAQPGNPASQTRVADEQEQPRVAVQSQQIQQASYQAPQNTLEAQAEALARGEENPSLTKPDGGNFGSNLYKTGTEPKQVASIYSATSAKGSIKFLPIIGAPVQAVTPLSRQLGAAARAGGLTIKGSNDPSAEHIIKGYLSAFPDGSNISVTYVWDILDSSGNRLHRIQGQEAVPAKGGDAWASVSPEVMQKIGEETISQYLQWDQSQI